MQMSIEDKLREIADAFFPRYSYVFEDWNGASEVLDRVSLPAIICILPVGGSIALKNGRTKDSENILLAFVDKVERDADGNDNEKVYTKMKDVAVKFICAMNESNYFEPISRFKYTTILEQGSVYYSGVFVELEAEEKQGRCL